MHFYTSHTVQTLSARGSHSWVSSHIFCFRSSKGRKEQALIRAPRAKARVSFESSDKCTFGVLFNTSHKPIESESLGWRRVPTALAHLHYATFSEPTDTDFFTSLRQRASKLPLDPHVPNSRPASRSFDADIHTCKILQLVSSKNNPMFVSGQMVADRNWQPARLCPQSTA